MIMAQANFADLLKAADDAGFSNCPPGIYDVRVIATEVKTTAGGKEMIIVKFEVISGPNSGRKVSNNFVISPENANALGFFFRHMRAMGLDSVYFAANPPIHQVAADLMNKICRIEVGTRTWNGEEREDVKKIMAPVGGTPVAPSAPVLPQSVASPVGVSTAADPNAPGMPPF